MPGAAPAWSATRLGDGTTRFTINLPDAVATRLHTYLEAFTSPRHSDAGQHGTGEADRIPVDRKRGQAFCSLMEAIDPKRLPVHGGDATTLIVTVSIDDLRKDLGTAELGPADKLTAGEVRRLACTAKIIPAVLGGKSEVLDLGRSSRFFKPAQRKAMIIRDRECRAEGCTVPAAWCEAHHWGRPWAEGGRTDVKDGVLLCNWHHHRAHDPRYEANRMPDGDIRFTPATLGRAEPGRDMGVFDLDRAAICWVDLPRQRHRRRLREPVGDVQELLDWFGVRGSVSQRAHVFLAAIGVDPHRRYGAMDLGSPDYLVGERRRDLIAIRDRWLAH